MSEMPFVKYLLVAIFVLILVSLGSAFFSLFRAKDTDSTATVKALTVRVGLSIGLVLAIFILNALGVISPNG